MATITVDVRAQTGTFKTDMDKAARASQRFARDVERQFQRLGSAIGIALTLAGASIVALTKQAIDAADNFAKMSQKVGVSVESLSTLAYAADQSGVSLQQLQTGLVRLAKNASDAASGTGDAIRAFDAMGISVKDAEGNLKSTESLLSEVAEKLSGYEDSAQKTALAVQLFGRAGAELLPLLNAGADGIAKLQSRARDLGLEIDGNTAKKAEQFNDLLSDMGELVKGFGNDLATALLPGLAELADRFVDAGIEGRKASSSAQTFADGIKAVIGVTISAVAQIQKLGAIIGAIFAQIGLFGSTLKEQFAAFAQYQKDIFDIGPIDAALKLQETGFGNVANAIDQAKSNLAALKDTFAEIDAGAEAKIAALNTRFKQQAEAANGPKGAAPAIKNLAEEAKKLAKAQAEAERRAKAMRDWFAGVAKAGADFRREIAMLAAQLQGPLAVATLQNAEAVEALNDLFFEGAITAEEAAEAMELYAEVLKRTAKEIEENSDEARELESILSRFDNIGFSGLVREIELVKQALEEATDPAVIARLQNAMGGLRQEMLVGMVGAAQQVLGSMQSMTKEGSKAYKAMEVASHALNVVLAVGAILNQGKGDPYTAFARMAAMAVAVAGLVGSIGANFGGSSGFTDTAARRQETQGTGSVLGDATAKSESILRASEITADATSQLVGINRGMLRALHALRDSIGSATNMLARGAGRAGFSDLPDPTRFRDVFLGGALSFLPLDPLGILGGSSRITDQGIIIVGDLIEGIVVGAFQEVQSRSWRFGSRRTSEEIVAVSDSLEAQFQLIISSIVDTVREGALALGLLPSEIEAALESFRLEEIRISLMDLSAEEQQAELQAVFGEIFDDLAGHVVPFVAQFQRVGEGLGETLVRVATGVQVMQEAIARLGFTLDTTDPETFAQISEGLIELVGGVNAFIEGMSSFIDRFATDEQKFEMLQSDLTRAFEQSGLVIPATRDGMWALMQSLDASNESGREQIATLLRLADVADAYYTHLERRAEEVVEALEEQFNAEAAMDYARAVGDLNRQLMELDGVSEYQIALHDVSQQYRANVARLNELARASGLVGARHEDLALAMQVAVAQMARAIAQLEEQGRQLVESLGYDALSGIDRQIAELERMEAEASSSVQSFGEAMQEAAQVASDAINLLLGDLSPLRDRQKLPLALQALREGQVGPEEVLRIAQRLFSGSAYRRVFDQVMAIGDRRQQGGQPVDPVTFAVQTMSREMRELLAEREQLLQRQEAAQRFTQAGSLAQIIADLAGARGEDFETIAQSLGLTGLDQLLTDLQLGDMDALNEYLTNLQADSYSLADLVASVTAGEQLIVDTLREAFDLDQALSFQTPDASAKPIIDEVSVPMVEAQTKQTDEVKGLREDVVGLRSELAELLAEIAGYTGKAAAHTQQIAETGSIAQVEMVGASDRSVRRTRRNPMVLEP